MSRRLRPVTGRSKPSQGLSPTPAGLENPYARYYTQPRSFERLIQQRRAQTAEAPKK